MNSNRETRSLKRIVFVIAVAAVSAVAVPFVSPFLTDVLAQTATNTVEAEVDTRPAASVERPVTVEVTRALNRVVSQSRTVAGRVEPARTVDLAFQIPGQIIRLEVEPGDTIREGEVIAELDQIDFELAVDRAQASYDLANSELARASDLADRGVASDARLDTARGACPKRKSSRHSTRLWRAPSLKNMSTSRRPRLSRVYKMSARCGS